MTICFCKYNAMKEGVKNPQNTMEQSIMETCFVSCKNKTKYYEQKFSHQKN